MGAEEPRTGERLVYVGRGSQRWGLPPSPWGNPFPVTRERPAADAVALFAGWLATQPELLESLEELRGARLYCHCGPLEPCHADVLLAALADRGSGCWRPFTREQRIVAGLMLACHHNGADLRVDANSEVVGKIFPRQEVDAGNWVWKTARQLVWLDDGPHINVLECEAALMALRWRARAVCRQRRAFLHLLDSMVNIGALSKHRSSSNQLNKVVRAFSVLELAMDARGIFGFTSSAKNPADAPSRLTDG